MSRPVARSLSMDSPELPRSMVPEPLGVAEGKWKTCTPQGLGNGERPLRVTQARGGGAGLVLMVGKES